MGLMELPSLTPGQYSLVYNLMSVTIASFLATFIYFLFGREHVAQKYRKALLTSALVVGIAAYHYFRILHSFADAYVLDTELGKYIASGKPFNDAYRYADWLITVPLLLVELIQVMALDRAKSRRLISILTISAVFMLITGYFGEIERGDTSLFSVRGLWGFISTIGFVVILVTLFREIKAAMDRETGRVRILFRNIGLLTLFAWGFYPIVYMAPFFGWGGGATEATIQIGYSLADIIAKAGYGLMIFAIAREKTIAEQGE